MANDNFILTQEGKDKLEEELHYLETEKRAEIGERIKVAREFGDISENSEYDDAKNEQGMMEARIAEISRILSEATVVNTPKRSSKVNICLLYTSRTVEGQAKRLDEAKAQDAPSAGTGRPTQERHAGTPAPSSDPGDR